MAESYFSHDAGARNDTKLLNVRMKYGATGYGIYFMLLERMRLEEDYSQPTNYNVLAFDLHEPPEVIQAIVEDFDLFFFDDNHSKFYSKSFNKRMEQVEAKSKRYSQAGKKGAKKRWENKEKKNSDAIATPNKKDSQAIAKPKQRYSQAIATLKRGNSQAISQLMRFDSNKIKLNKINKIKLNKIKEDIKDISPKNGEPDNAKALTKSDKIKNDFELLWKLYPRKQRKTDALKAYKKAIKAGATNKQIQNGIVAYCKYIQVKGIEQDYICQGGTWFNQQRWNDELDLTPKSKAFGKGRVEALPDWAKEENTVKEQALDPEKEKALRDRIAKLKSSQGVIS